MNYKLNKPFTPTMLKNYLNGLVNQFFKIIPLKECEEPSLHAFMESFQAELLGFKSLIDVIGEDSMYLSLLSILQYLIDNDCPIQVVRREVFQAISICKKLIKKYGNKGA